MSLKRLQIIAENSGQAKPITNANAPKTNRIKEVKNNGTFSPLPTLRRRCVAFSTACVIPISFLEINRVSSKECRASVCNRLPARTIPKPQKQRPNINIMAAGNTCMTPNSAASKAVTTPRQAIIPPLFITTKNRPECSALFKTKDSKYWVPWVKSRNNFSASSAGNSLSLYPKNVISAEFSGLKGAGSSLFVDGFIASN